MRTCFSFYENRAPGTNKTSTQKEVSVSKAPKQGFTFKTAQTLWLRCVHESTRFGQVSDKGPYAPQGSRKLRKWSRRSKSALQMLIRTSQVRYSRSIGEVNSNRVTSSLLRKWTRLPTDAYEVRALTFKVTENFESNDVLPCGAYGPRIGRVFVSASTRKEEKVKQWERIMSKDGKIRKQKIQRRYSRTLQKTICNISTAKLLFLSVFAGLPFTRPYVWNPRYSPLFVQELDWFCLFSKLYLSSKGKTSVGSFWQKGLSELNI